MTTESRMITVTTSTAGMRLGRLARATSADGGARKDEPEL
jgi:hypothetical protein